MVTTDTSSSTPTTRSDLVVDGRTARRNRNRIAVLDALIDLANEGDDEPSIESIAERAGVSYRSVYRYFDDRTELMLAAIGRLMEEIQPLLATDAVAEGSLGERITYMVGTRISVYRKVAPLARIAVRRRLHEPTVAEQYQRVRELFSERLAALFDAELSALPPEERRLVVAGLEVVFQFEALDFLARHEALTDDEITRVLTRHAWYLLEPGPTSLRAN